MKVVYVCGYGRSGSTILGAVLADVEQAICLGEATHVGKANFVASAICACGHSYSKCPYWSAFELALSPTTRRLLPRPCAQVLEGGLGLLIPLRILASLMNVVPFSDSRRDVTLRSGIEALMSTAGGTVIDTSKTTRLTANRPRLYRAAGADVELVLPKRTLQDVVTSYLAAGERQGRRRSRTFAQWQVRLVRQAAFLAARCNAWLLDADLLEIGNERIRHFSAGLGSPGRRFDHSIAGNRLRRGVTPGGVN